MSNDRKYWGRTGKEVSIKIKFVGEFSNVGFVDSKQNSKLANIL
ncbi:unnamed protein product [Brugia pahangi]|uniref:CSD domain-containing protein n=1 Tax=Brugia pahangi TaxID=6280 RepID=A0A0N4SZH0_BRUPA|nr:unnamed protein product [Brugia pahangi]